MMWLILIRYICYFFLWSGFSLYICEFLFPEPVVLSAIVVLIWLLVSDLITTCVRDALCKSSVLATIMINMFFFLSEVKVQSDKCILSFEKGLIIFVFYSIKRWRKKKSFIPSKAGDKDLIIFLLLFHRKLAQLQILVGKLQYECWLPCFCISLAMAI